MSTNSQTPVTTVATSLFGKMYNAKPETIEAQKQPLVEKQLKRKFQAAYDSAEEQKMSAEIAINKLQADVKNYDLNAFLRQSQIAKDAEATKEAIAAHYVEMFGEELPNA